jgi:hypothetical protein
MDILFQISSMKIPERIGKYYRAVFTGAVFLLTVPLHAQQRFPVTANTSLTPPYSVYLNDYISPGSTTLRCDFVFNDFREPTWQVRFKIKIESPDLKLETRPDFVPERPVIVTPGVSVPLSGVDLSP